MVSYMIQDGCQNRTEGARANGDKAGLGFKMVLLMHCFYLTVLISKQTKTEVFVNQKTANRLRKVHFACSS